MNVIDRTDTAVLVAAESDEEDALLSDQLRAFNGTDALVAYRHNRPDESDEYTPVALAKRSDRGGCGGDCGGCGGRTERSPVGGLGDLVRRALTYLGDLVLATLAGAGIGALINLFGDDALRALSRLVEP